MGRYILTVPARQDLKEISRFITQFNPAAGRRFKNRIQQQCRQLADFPNMGLNRDDLEPRLQSFPVEDYLIFYRPIDQGIEIVRVVSGYRDLEALFLSQDDTRS